LIQEEEVIRGRQGGEVENSIEHTRIVQRVQEEGAQAQDHEQNLNSNFCEILIR